MELASGYRLPDERGEIALNVFATDVVGRVELLPLGIFVQAQNIQDEWVLGGELDASLWPWRPLRLRLLAGVAHTVARSAEAALAGRPQVTNPAFPSVQAHLVADWRAPWLGLRLSAEASLIGPRSATFSNALLRGADYSLPAYFYSAVAVSTAGLRLLPAGETSVALRVSNLLNTAFADPGFGGVDVPGLGVTTFLTVVQSL
jgi:hypothetical protein